MPSQPLVCYTSSMQNLRDKVAVITGGNDGIGKSLAFKLAKQGVKLALVARDEERLASTKEALAHAIVHTYSCDLRESAQRKESLERILSDFGTVDILVNNAGIIHKTIPLEELDEETVTNIIETNLTGLIHYTRLFLPHLKKQPEAAIINVASIAGVRAVPGQSVYAASKWGVRGFTKVLREELKDSTVRVAGLYQAGTRTSLFDKAGEKRPLETYTEPDDLADVIVTMLNCPKKLWMSEVHVDH